MSVTAHLTEMYVLKYKLPQLNFRWMALGCYFPDGLGASKLLLLATGDASYHRDIVFGWMHSFPVCGAAAAAIGSVFGARAGWSFAFAAWLHVVMDLGDPLGEKVFFPLSSQKYSLALWPWDDRSIVFDLARYYTSPVSFTVEATCLALSCFVSLRMCGTLNPIRGGIRLFNREHWFDTPNPSVVNRIPLRRDA